MRCIPRQAAQTEVAAPRRPVAGIVALAAALIAPQALPQVFVDANAPGPADGDSWATAHTDLTTALFDAVVLGEQIWVADGTYTDPFGIFMEDGVEVYGGFEGSGGVEETLLSQRDITANVTVIDIPPPPDAPVVFAAVVNARLDGFRIISSMSTNFTGVEFTFADSTNTLANCVILGGAIGASCLSNASPNIINCVISSDEPLAEGVSCANSSAPAITNCTISGTTVPVTGAIGIGVSCLGSSTPTVTNTIIQSAINGIWELDTSSDVTATFNLFGDNATDFTDEQVIDLVGAAAINAVAENSNNISGTARFVDAINGDFRQANFSEAVDQGAGPAAGIPDTDLAGSPRVDNPDFLNGPGGFYDIGAFEGDGSLIASFRSIGTGGGNWDEASTWLDGIVPTSADDVEIAAGDTVTVPGSVDAECSDIDIEPGSVLDLVSDVSRLHLHGTALINQGTLSGPGTLIFEPSFLGSVAGSVTFSDVEVQGTVDFGGASVIGGTLDMAGGAVVGTGPAYAANSTLLYTFTGATGAEWGAGSTLGTVGVPDDVSIQGSVVVGPGDHTVIGTLSNFIPASPTLAQLTANSAVLRVGGDFSNGGVFDAGSGTVRFNGGATSNLSLSTPTTFHHLIVNSGTTLVSDPDTTVSISGDFTNAGAFDANGGTVEFGGGDTSTLALSTPTAFNNLVVRSGTTLLDDIDASLAGTVSGAGTILGASRAVGGPGPVDFGITGPTMNVVDATDLTGVTVDYIGTDPPGVIAAGFNQSRHWSITPTGSPFTVDLTLPHTLAASHENARVTRIIDTTTFDAARTSSTVDTVTRAGITELSLWAVTDGDPATPEITQIDLSQWTYIPGIVAAGVLGSGFPGDPQAAGTLQPDADSDGSGADLSLSIGDTSGDSFHWFISPNGLIPYAQDGTFWMEWTVSTSNPSPPDSAQLRTRWEYGVTGNLGGGNILAAPRVAPPSAAGRRYVQIFDHLDVAGADATLAVGADSFPENSVHLFFEQIDLLASEPQGDLVLRDLVFNRLDPADLDSVAMLEAEVTDFSAAAGQISEIAGAPFSSNLVDVTLSPANAVIDAPTANGSPGITVFGDLAIALTEGGVGVTPFTPSSTAGRFYRAEIDVDSAGNSPAAPLPILTAKVQTFDPGLGSVLFTSETQVNSLRDAAFGGPGGLNPDYSGTSTYAAYLVLPEGGDLSGASPPAGQLGFGTQLTANVGLQDNSDGLGGAVMVTGMRIQSFPESVLP